MTTHSRGAISRLPPVHTFTSPDQQIWDDLLFVAILSLLSYRLLRRNTNNDPNSAVAIQALHANAELLDQRGTNRFNTIFVWKRNCFFEFFSTMFQNLAPTNSNIILCYVFFEIHVAFFDQLCKQFTSDVSRDTAKNHTCAVVETQQ